MWDREVIYMHVTLNTEEIVELITQGSVDVNIQYGDNGSEVMPAIIYFDKEDSSDDPRLSE